MAIEVGEGEVKRCLVPLVTSGGGAWGLHLIYTRLTLFGRLTRHFEHIFGNNRLPIFNSYDGLLGISGGSNYLDCGGDGRLNISPVRIYNEEPNSVKQDIPRSAF